MLKASPMPGGLQSKWVAHVFFSGYLACRYSLTVVIPSAHLAPVFRCKLKFQQHKLTEREREPNEMKTTRIEIMAPSIFLGKECKRL